MKDIRSGDEIAVRYAPNDFSNGNKDCLCLTCEQKGQSGWRQFDAEGMRIMPDEVKVEEKDENGVTIIIGTCRPRRLPRDYKERAPSPLLKIIRRKRKRKAAELQEQPKALSELTVVEDEESNDTIVVELPPSPPLPPRPRRQVPRREPQRRTSPKPCVRWISLGSTLTRNRLAGHASASSACNRDTLAGNRNKVGDMVGTDS